MTGFGGGRDIGLHTGLPWGVSLVTALILGYVVAFGIYHLMVFINRNVGSSEARVSETVGLTAEIITPITEDSVGEIAYITRGSRYTAPARSLDGRTIGRGRPVKIWRLVGATYYVKEILPEEAEHSASATPEP